MSLQMGTNKCASQMGRMAPRTQRHIYDTKLGTDNCRLVYTQGANQKSQVSGLGWQIYDPTCFPQGPVADGAPGSASNCPSPGKALEYPSAGY
ncbi:hypothetical protein QTO34_002356 [Cnephaeus nilssonii]|uniref:Uncharacterized protein n=1 Tax=Cnephaeus nilssonii TaxID=3371016 RepID=A0AA40LN45_CNENI|nr:hypothetical protein QTO34_002356 [Eptesicus nilssonii]